MTERIQKMSLLYKKAKTHTISSEDVASTPSDPGHVFKAQKSGIHSQAGATFPNATNITWTNPGQKRDCEATAQECPTMETNVSVHEKQCGSILNQNKCFIYQEAGMWFFLYALMKLARVVYFAGSMVDTFCILLC